MDHESIPTIPPAAPFASDSMKSIDPPMGSRLSILYFLITILCSVPASRALDETETLSLLVRTIQSTAADETRAALLEGMLKGMEGRRDVTPPIQWSALAAELANSPNESVRKSASQLSQIFGDQAATEQAFARLLDPGAPADARRSALGSLIALRYPPLGEQLGDLVDIDELRLDAIRAFAVIPRRDAPEFLLSRFPNESDETKRAIIETLATRKEYASALVDGIKNQVITREQVPAYIARSLKEILGAEFTDVYGQIAALNQNTSQTIAKYKAILTNEVIAAANIRHGRNVFQKTCGACHLMYGVGGVIGPDLTGSNRANLDYLLLNSVDPSADVPEGYRTQLVQTVDGRVLTGVLAEENNQRIILKTVDQPRLVIAKDDIEQRKVSNQSMMPEGQLDQLSRTDLVDLVKYMQSKTQVEMAE